MSSMLKALSDCICGFDEPYEEYGSEKRPLVSHDARTSETMATQIVQTLLEAEKGGRSLENTLNAIVGTNGWTERIAQWTLEKLEQALGEATKLGPVLKEAYDQSCETARAMEGFVQEHPVALGVLVLVAPWAIQALGFATGFGELGPIEGSFAAMWQARYAGLVPKGSLFSFFQRLGMTWPK
ncbi:hypothetical protein K504DRAFT_464819 [Pleomassaria siparia CBS 279.74]|uniref:Uncharacterized protein n=1 Tax=Pleomassaria siparia CBS 279.74 TaxID=1314801 RepID=A0A6G1KK67_9PLEO|nr:hypothetical protein K504DRAFT_464819 [Pleomassaria siparia CBS 279.74]